MDKHLKNIIETVINIEVEEVRELNFSDMNKLEKAEYEKAGKKVSDLQDALAEQLPEKFKKLFNEYMDAVVSLNTIEGDYMFNRGVKKGLTKLSFIRKELGEVAVIMLQDN